MAPSARCCLLALLGAAVAFRLPQEDRPGEELDGIPEEPWHEEWEQDPQAQASAAKESLSAWSARNVPATLDQKNYTFGWIKPRKPGRLAYFDVHIAKCAGASWAHDIMDVVPNGEGYHIKEACYYNPGEKSAHAHDVLAGDRMVVLLRRPSAHVYSQFLECKYSRFGRDTVRGADRLKVASFTTWLRHFDGGKQTYDLRCYHPYNMQTRALSCDSDLNFAPHHYDVTGEPSLKRALESVKQAFFVGLVEHYHASLCLFLSKARAKKKLPSHCDCRNKEAWNSFKSRNITHKLPSHSLADLSQEQLSLVGALTRMDVAVYWEAQRRFAREARELKDRTGVQILCELVD